MLTINQDFENCKCCQGTGVQTNIQTGISEICKCCGGSGRRIKQKEQGTITICETGGNYRI